MTALGLKKGTKGEVQSIESLVNLYLEREVNRMSNAQQNIDRVDILILQGIGSRDSLQNLWSVIKDIILERVTRKPRRKRNAIAQPKLIEWVESNDPEMVLTDLPQFNQSRIEDIHELLEGLELRGGVLKNRDNSSLPYTTGDIGGRQDS